jgi:hypothetical protein
MSSFNRNIPFPDNPQLINVEGQGLTLLEKDQELKGNLDNVDEKNLLKAEPKDLKVGDIYLLINNSTNEKTVAYYKSYSEDEYNDFFYTFEDKDGELEIKANNISNSDDSNESNYSNDSDDKTINEDPYSPLLSFDTDFSVYIPQIKKNLKKILDKKLPEDVTKEITSYLNYGGKFKKNSKKNQKSLKKTIKSKKRRIKKTIKSKKRRIKKTIKSKRRI